MTFDDGAGSNLRLTSEDFKAKIKAAMTAEGIAWHELCRRARLAPARAAQVIAEGTYGLPQNMNDLVAIAGALGRNVDWLLHGDASGGREFKTSLEERVRRLGWEYIYKAEVPKEDRDPLIQMLVGAVERLSCNTFQAAARVGVPRTWKDVARYYEALKQGKGE